MTSCFSEHFTYKKLLRFTVPSMVMMVFTSIYGVVDGFFVSNFVGKTPFAAINLIMPFLMICGALGFMIGTGGSALVAKTLGEGQHDRANKLFSMLIYLSMIFGAVISTLGLIFLRPIATYLGAEGEILENCVLYGRILLPVTPFFMLQNEFQSFLVAAERPKLGLAVTLIAGGANIMLDALLVAVFPLGLVGAAVATAVSQILGGMIPMIFFFTSKKSLLRLGKTVFDGKALLKSCANGSSEFVTNISMSVVSMAYNLQLMKIAGENGVAAYGVVMYVSFIFISIFLGYAIGSAPVISFHFGAQNQTELKSLLKKSLIINASFALAITLLAEFGAKPLALVFVGYDATLFEITRRALAIYSVSFLLAGFNIFSSAFFTALNDGFVSASISFLRTMLFQLVTVLCLPALLPPARQLDGIWLAITVAELLSLAVSVAFLITTRKKYQY